MSVMDELSPRDIRDILAEAVTRQAPVVVTVQVQGRWCNSHSSLTGKDAQRLVLDMPLNEAGATHEFAPGEQVGVSFKLKHHKYVFLAEVVGQQGPDDPGDRLSSPRLVLKHPLRMQRLQRRAYIRAEVPAGAVVRCSFWIGGLAAEPSGTSPDRPVWSARIVDISAGGFQARTADQTVFSIETGFAVGVRVLFGPGKEAIFADALIRHVAPDGDGAVIGFQFVGLEQSDEGRRTLKDISYHAAEFQHIAERRAAQQAKRHVARQAADAEE